MTSNGSTDRRGRGFRRRGFTLIEVLIVLAIVLALTAIVGVAVFGRQDQAKADLAEIDLNNIKRALRGFRADFGQYPTDEEGIAVLWDSELLDPERDTNAYLSGGYLEEPITEDAWGNEWNYRAESEYGDEYDLWSNGPDGEEGTEDDIVSWNPEDGGGDFGFGPESGGVPAGGPPAE